MARGDVTSGVLSNVCCGLSEFRAVTSDVYFEYNALSALELNSQLKDHSKKKVFGHITKVLKPPAASAGPADLTPELVLVFFFNKPGRKLPRGQYHFGMGPQLAI
jgi:hypothetical protein